MDKDYKMIQFTEDGLSLDVRVDAEKETVWLTQAEMAELFDVDRTRIVRHLRNIYESGELNEGATCAKSAQVHREGGRTVTRVQPLYNLEAIISVGYRVKSRRGSLPKHRGKGREPSLFLGEGPYFRRRK